MGEVERIRRVLIRSSINARVESRRERWLRLFIEGVVMGAGMAGAFIVAIILAIYFMDVFCFWTGR